MATKKTSKKEGTTKLRAAKTSAKKPSAKVATRFKGHVASAHDVGTSASGVFGARQVWYPQTRTAVGDAVERTRSLRTFVRSGTQVAAEDVVDAAGGVVISLTGLTKVAVKERVVSADAGATTEAVARYLAAGQLALPIVDNPQQSIASAVFGDEPSPLMRTLGPLVGFVSRLHAFDPTGKAMSLRDSAEGSAVARARKAGAVVAGVRFEADSAQGLWMFRKTFPYPGKDGFLALSRALFEGTEIPARADLLLDAYAGAYGIPLVRVSAFGRSADDRLVLESLVGRGLAVLPVELADDIIAEDFADSEVMKAVADSGQAIPLDPVVTSSRLRATVQRDVGLDAYLLKLVEDVDRGLAFASDRTGKIDEDLRLFARTQLNREDRLEVSGLAHQLTPLPRFASMALVSRASSPLHDGLPQAFAVERPIPNFRGAVFTPSHQDFAKRAEQYATSSYPEADTRPFMLAYPEDEDDIGVALAFARAHDKRVVARSGGHQYCGKSSGDQGTIVLSMDKFNALDVTDNVAVVGPAVPLTTLAREFRRREITIPHGECPQVNVGGHAQTGGYGHLLRAFGLTLDHVVAFRIVLADGAVREVQRPVAGVAHPNDDIFWGVLGGNAGSFGVITQYRFECIRDDAHPNAYRFSAIRKYTQDRYRGLMKQVQAWTVDVAAGTKLSDVDFMMTVRSDSAITPYPLLLVETVHSNLGGPAENVDGDKVFEDIIDATKVGWKFWERLWTTQGRAVLSKVSDSFVRRFPETTWDGREFSFPYKKRINCTRRALTDTFVAAFVGLVDEAVTTDGVYLIFQMLIGGGQHQQSDRRAGTSIPHRDFVFCFVFDLFYDEGYEGPAIALQGKMQVLVDEDFSDGQEQRLFWGSFGPPSELDMTRAAVQRMYYDNAADYARLRSLKKRLDPDDLFHTSLTVKLP